MKRFFNSSSKHKRYNKEITSTRSSIVDLENEANKYNQLVDIQDLEYYPGTETDHYDYDYERHGLNKTNLSESIAHMVKGTLGAGVMTMHEAFMVGGLWTSLATTLIIGFINYYAMYILGSSAQLMYRRTRMSKLSYPDLAELAAATGPCKFLRKCSKIFRYTVDVCIVSCMGGTCCIYQIMIASTFKLALEGFNIDLKPWLHDDVRLYILCITPFLLGLCVIRSLKILAPFSMLSDVLVAICVLTTLYYSLQTGEHVMSRPGWKNIHDFMKLIGICVYCTCGIGVCLPVENNMKRPNQFAVMIALAMVAVTILTAATGFFGYWGWGENCMSPITVHMPPTTFTTVLQVLLGFMLCVTFSVQFWVPFRIFWHYISIKYSSRSGKIRVTIERLYRVLLVFVVTCVAVTFPTLMPFMAFIGHFFLGFMAFTFPALIESLITWRDDRRNKVRWRSLKNLIIIGFGLVLSCSAFHYDWKLMTIF